MARFKTYPDSRSLPSAKNSCLSRETRCQGCGIGIGIGIKKVHRGLAGKAIFSQTADAKPGSPEGQYRGKGYFAVAPRGHSKRPLPQRVNFSVWASFCTCGSGGSAAKYLTRRYRASWPNVHSHNILKPIGHGTAGSLCQRHSPRFSDTSRWLRDNPHR